MSGIRLHAALPLGDAGHLERGRDLLLPDDPTAVDAPPGTLLNDWLGAEGRVRAHERAERVMAAWRERVDPFLTRGGICLGHTHTGHLLTDVFLELARIEVGIEAFLESEPAGRVELHGADPALARTLAGMLAQAGARPEVIGAGPLPRYPISFARSVRRGRLAPLREATSLRGRPRGQVLIQAFRHLTRLWSALPARGVEPVLDPVVLPGLPRRELALRAWRGGFIGHPGRRAVRRSHTEVAAAIDSVPAPPPADRASLAELADQRALLLLRQVAGDTLARAGVFRAAARRGVRTAVVPSDTATYARTFASATSDLGCTLVYVQHGFFGDQWRIDGKLVPYVEGLEAERVAVWGPRDARRLEDQARGEVVVTGNPGVSSQPLRTRGGAAALVLLQPVGRSSLAFDVRAARRYAEEALAGLAAARFAGPVVLRPHPLDLMSLTGLETHGLRPTVEQRAPLERALTDARLCIGTVSTATLEAIRAGVPTAFLDVTGATFPWPFDPAGPLPRATDRASLAELLAELGRAPDAAASEAAAEALGAQPDALDGSRSWSSRRCARRSRAASHGGRPRPRPPARAGARRCP